MSKKESNININKLNIGIDNKINQNKSKNNKIKTEENYNIIKNKNIQQDLIFFKDDILKDLRTIKNKLNEELVIQKDEQTNKLNLYGKQIEDQAQKVEYLSNIITESMKKTKAEELLEKLNTKTEENFAKVDLKMNNIQKEIRDGLYKHEKFMNESILYPGIIGYECRFSNFHSFIDYVLSNIHQILVYQEIIKGFEFHKIKDKINKELNIIKIQLKNNFKALSEFTTEKINESEKKMKNLLDDYNTKFVDIRVENNESANMLKNQINDVANSFGKILEIKNEIEEKFEKQDKKIENIKIDITNKETKINEQKNEIDNFEKKMDLLTTYIDNNLNNLIQIIDNNNLDMSTKNKTFKGRRIHSAKEYIEGKINPNNTDNDNYNKNLKKNKRFNYKGESFIKRYIKGKIELSDMYKHPKDFVHDIKDENKIIKRPNLKLDKESLSEEKINKNHYNEHFFSLTTVNTIKNKKENYVSNKRNKSSEGSIKLNSNINLNSNLSLSKGNKINSQSFNIYEKENNQSYELKKHNNLSFSHKEKNKNLKIESNINFKNNQIIMRNNSSQTRKINQFIKIDYVTRIPDIEINKVCYPDKETKKKILLTKSLSDGNFNYVKGNNAILEDFFEKRNKKTKQKAKYNNFKSPNNYISNRQTFGNKFIRQQFAKEKISKYLFNKPKKKLLIVQ